MKKPSDIEKLFRCDGKKKVRLAKIDPRQKTGFEDRKKAERRTEEDVRVIDELQDRLYAENKQALLVIFQAIDAGGKNGTIRRIFGPVDPLGMRAVGFKAPTPEELAHDFLWRIHRQTPAKGEICAFNRSHYEDVLVARVRNLAPRGVIERRYEQINGFEKLLADHGVTIVKLFLHISKEEQRERLQERIDLPEKRWKFNPGDLEDRKLWDDYMEAYEIALNRCSTPWAPWYVVPADRNWYRDAVAAAIIRSRLQAMDPQYPVKEIDTAIRVV